VDAWSLGVLLFTMLEAEVPFQKEEDIVKCELRHKKLQSAATALCRDLIKLMLQKDQSKRISLEQVLRHPWLNEEVLSSPMCPPATTRSLGSSKIASQPPGHSTTSSTSSSNQEKPVFQPMVVVKYNEKTPANSYPYLTSPMSPVVHTNECAVHS